MNIQVMTIPTKKRIHTELFIDWKQGLHLQNGVEETDQ